MLLVSTGVTANSTEDGTFALWPDTRNNALTVIVSKGGYQPVTTTVKLKRGRP
ncbi:hypothetical protein ACFU6I_37080 [Streptomyces sp. NPDC057486]|uniref:hypothetical protein n=1 Tax=Streptomyces sp. NPDC057486 TaxID=3346145 RepID=UPI0036843A20